MPHRPEHRTIDTHRDDVVDLHRPDADGRLRLECTRCRPDVLRTVPVRFADDPDTVVRCAGCGKKHSTDSLTVVGL